MEWRFGGCFEGGELYGCVSFSCLDIHVHVRLVLLLLCHIVTLGCAVTEEVGTSQSSEHDIIIMYVRIRYSTCVCVCIRVRACVHACLRACV